MYVYVRVIRVGGDCCVGTFLGGDGVKGISGSRELKRTGVGLKEYHIA